MKLFAKEKWVIRKIILLIVLVVFSCIYHCPNQVYANEEEVLVKAFVERMYTIVLGRTAEEDGLSYWTNELLSQSIDGAGLAQGFIISDEFAARGLQEDGYINILYYTFFDRAPDDEGSTYWISQLENGVSRAEVLSGFVNSKEFGQICSNYGIARGTMDPDGTSIFNSGVRNFVQRLYLEVLLRNGELEGIEYWCYAINKGQISPVDCAKDFFYSEEFLSRNSSDEEFIETLYRTFMGRTYDEAGKAYWINQMQAGMLRDMVLSEFASSREFRQIIAQYGVSLGNTSIYSTSATDPFSNQLMGDCSFRIPAMVSLDDGRIVAAADARWNSKSDGGGNDTVVSFSDDYGKTWRQSFANYLGENGNIFSSYSTTFADPALATDGQVVYLLVDFLPSGYAFYGSEFTLPKGGVGFDIYGRLLLKKNGESSYNYYLQDGAIYNKSGVKQEGYSVDGYFNIYGEGIISNLFYVFESPFTVYPTEYLYLTKSLDGGQSWSAPKLLNVKQMYEQGYSVGCGRGTILSDGTIIFPCYKTVDGEQNSSFIYSTDGGETFTRTQDANAYNHSCSEAVIIELNKNLIRMFYRDGYNALSYVDYTRSGRKWLKQKSGIVPGITKTGHCQLNAIKYDDNTILISTPASGTEDRNTGLVTTIYLDESYEMTVKNYCSVNGYDSFGYSCMTKLLDGSVGLLYESEIRENVFKILYKHIMPEDLGIY